VKSRPAAINSIWLFLILASIIVAAYTGTMEEVTKASFDSAKGAVTLALSLIGAMALWLGIMKVAEVAGLTLLIARAIRPVMVRLFPDVPPEHPAMSAMIMNMAANMLGLGNAATPLGIKAITELDRLNPEKGTATNAMCLFLAINTSSVTLLPLGVIAVRSAAGASQPAAILFPAILATLCSTTAAVLAAKFLSRRNPVAVPRKTSSIDATDTQDTAEPEKENHQKLSPVSLWMKIVISAVMLLFIGAIPYRLITTGTPLELSLDLITKGTNWLVPFIMGLLLVFGYLRGVRVYEAVTEGAKEGFQVAVRIIPFMVAIFVAIGMFRASGALELFGNVFSKVLLKIGMPTDVLPLALLRPLSGTGSFGVMSEIVSTAPDSFSSFLASIMQGSTETTFYVLAVYFGAVGIRKTRHALSAALFADGIGITASLIFGHLFFALMK
jgi:spore maturation protein SpmA